LSSILMDGFLWSDAEVQRRGAPGTTIGMAKIKRRRMNENILQSHFGVFVGDFVPFYFCPRSVMLYLLAQGNHPEMDYRGGQGPILHLVADLQTVVDWADEKNKKWAFTLSNAGSSYFEDRNDLNRLNELDWRAIQARDWKNCRDAKQSEFLLEEQFPWELVEGIGVHSPEMAQRVSGLLSGHSHRPSVTIQKDWYYIK